MTLPIFESKLHETEAAQRHSVLSKYNRNYFEILKTMHSLLRFFFLGIYSTPTDLIKLLQNSTFPVGQRQKAAECCAKKKTPLRSTSIHRFHVKGTFRAKDNCHVSSAPASAPTREAFQSVQPGRGTSGNFISTATCQ